MMNYRKKYFNSISLWEPSRDDEYQGSGGGGIYVPPEPTGQQPIANPDPGQTIPYWEPAGDDGGGGDTYVPPVNQQPVADPGLTQTIQLPVNSVTLDASASYDPEGSPLTYNWGMVFGPNTPTILNSNQAIATATDLVPGHYWFNVWVTDTGGMSHVASVYVLVLAAADSETIDPVLPPPETIDPVLPPPETIDPPILPPPETIPPAIPVTNAAPIANAGSNQTIKLPVDSVVLDGTASYDPENGTLEYYWEQVGGPTVVTWTDKDKAKATVSNLVEGHYTFKLTVMDSLGASSNATVYVDVLKANVTTVINTTAPVVSIQRAPYIPAYGPAGGGGGAGAGANIDVQARQPLKSYKINWWLLLFVACSTGYIIFGKNDKL